MTANTSPAPRPREPKGSSAGGRFAVTTRVEPSLKLRPPKPAGTDKYGFPVVECTRCDGRGIHGFNEVDKDRCYGCGGNGYVHSPEVLQQVVAEFAAAQRAASRPKVRELRVGDAISRPYGNQLSRAQFRTVARILVAPGKPTRYEGKGPQKRPAAYAAAVEFTDGTRDVVTTDTVYARRGAEVDPAPYVARATAAGPRPGKAQAVRSARRRSA